MTMQPRPCPKCGGIKNKIKLHQDDRRNWPIPSESTDILPSEFGSGPWFTVFDDSYYFPHQYELQEGACCNLFFPWARTYRWHPVSVIREILRWPCFDHISLEQAAKVFSRNGGYSYPIAEAAPRLSDDYAAYYLAREYGVYCHSCKTIKGKYDKDSIYEEVIYWPYSGWRTYGACDKCIAKNKQIAVERHDRQLAKDREFNRSQRELIRERERKWEASCASYAQKKKQQKEEKERQRVEMLAAYELVKELGLIDQIRQRETKHEAGKPDKHTERGNEKRPTCIRKADKGSVPKTMLWQ